MVNGNVYAQLVLSMYIQCYNSSLPSVLSSAPPSAPSPPGAPPAPAYNLAMIGCTASSNCFLRAFKSLTSADSALLSNLINNSNKSN